MQFHLIRAFGPQVTDGVGVVHLGNDQGRKNGQDGGFVAVAQIQGHMDQGGVGHLHIGVEFTGAFKGLGHQGLVVFVGGTENGMVPGVFQVGIDFDSALHGGLLQPKGNLKLMQQRAVVRVANIFVVQLPIARNALAQITEHFGLALNQ